MNAGHWRMATGGSRIRPSRSAGTVFRRAQLRSAGGCEQVAAVCYRVRNGAIEFLLVQTRGGRWTFPKGCVELGLTYAQSAALEAFEEAGVHGRMEQVPFARYLGRKRGGTVQGAIELAVHAHLCEVLQLVTPQESNRHPTWFSPAKAARRLQEDRLASDGDGLTRVLDRAVARIRRLQSERNSAPDALRKVRLEAENPGGIQGQLEQTSFFRYTRRHAARPGSPAEIEVALNAYLGKVLERGTLQEFNRTRSRLSPMKPKLPLLGPGPATDAPEKVQFIDHPRRTTGRAKPGGARTKFPR